MFPPVNHEASWPLHAAQTNNAAAVLIIPRVIRRSALCRRFEVPASPATSPVQELQIDKRHARD
jgi:hypothetical protein